jgi:hypothetical protein
MPVQWTPPLVDHIASILPNFPDGRSGHRTSWVGVANHLNQYAGDLGFSQGPYVPDHVRQSFHYHGAPIADPTPYYSVHNAYDAMGNLANPNAYGTNAFENPQYTMYGSWANPGSFPFF